MIKVDFDVSELQDIINTAVNQAVESALTDINKKEKLPHVLTVKELAEVLRVSVPQAYQIVKIEGFPVIEIGRKIIPTDLLFEWLRTESGIATVRRHNIRVI